MTSKEIKLLSSFIEELEDRFSNDGCNDWDFPKDWTEQEKHDFCKEFWTENGSPEEFNPNRLDLQNGMALSLLRKKLEDHFK